MRSFTALIIILFAFACAGEENSSVATSNVSDSSREVIPTDSATEYKGDTLRYLALGDSYTIGESVVQELRWPVQLAKKASDQFDELTILPPTIIARTGWTTQELSAAISDQNPSKDYELVSLLIGVNNQYRGYPIEDYPKEFERLLNTAIEHANDDKNRVFVVSIPDYGYTPFGKKNKDKISIELDEYNRINREISEENGVAYFYITDLSREGLIDSTLVAGDGLHPSGKQYSQWVERMLANKLFFNELIKE